MRPSAPSSLAVGPDADKILRGTFDALSEAGIWRDDGQVARGRYEKRYCLPDEASGVEIDVRELESADMLLGEKAS